MRRVFLLLLLAVPPWCAAQGVGVRSIRIRSAWGGLAPSLPKPVELTIQRQGDEFLQTASASTQAWQWRW